jgi:hypothetical protein
MTEIMPKNVRYARWLYEILLSWNIAWLVTMQERQRERPLLYMIVGKPLRHYLERLHEYSHLFEPTTILEQVAWSFLLAFYIFLLLRLLARFSPTRAFLRTLAGAIAIVGFPLFTLCFPYDFLRPDVVRFHLTVGFYWLFLEITFVLICGFLYYFEKWMIPIPLSIHLLLLHFGIWAWVTGSYVSLLSETRDYGFGSLAFCILTFFYFGLPILGLLSSLASGVYVKLTGGGIPLYATNADQQH